jgi:hypothetical protein
MFVVIIPFGLFLTFLVIRGIVALFALMFFGAKTGMSAMMGLNEDPPDAVYEAPEPDYLGGQVEPVRWSGDRIEPRL